MFIWAFRSSTCYTPLLGLVLSARLGRLLLQFVFIFSKKKTKDTH
jgi:hypothetical protein